MPSFSACLSLIRWATGCQEIFCSEECKARAFETHHSLLCLGVYQRDHPDLYPFAVAFYEHAEGSFLRLSPLVFLFAAFVAAHDLLRVYSTFRNVFRLATNEIFKLAAQLIGTADWHCVLVTNTS